MASQSLVGALRVTLGLDSAAFEGGMDAAEKKLKRSGRNIEKLGQQFIGFGKTMTLAVTAPFVALAATSAKAAIESRDATAQVEAGLRSMGEAAGRTLPQLEKQAKALQKLSTFDDDDIMRKVTANMLTFGNVSGEAFDRAQLAAVDMSTRLKVDLKDATIQIGKALNDPIKGISALGRAGIQFTEDQKAMIKSMVEAGNAAGAQSMILNELEKQFGGSGKAARDAAPGSDTIDRWRELQETIGELVLVMGERLLPIVDSLLTAFTSLSPGMQTFVVGAAAVLAVIGPLAIGVGALISGFGILLPLMAKFPTVLVLVRTGISALGLALNTLLLSPLGLVAIALAATAGALVYLANQSSETKARVEMLGAAVDEAEASLKSATERAKAAGVNINDLGKDAKKATTDFYGLATAFDMASKAAASLANNAKLARLAVLQQRRAELTITKEKLEQSQRDADIADTIAAAGSFIQNPITKGPLEKARKARRSATRDSLSAANKALSLTNQEIGITLVTPETAFEPSGGNSGSVGTAPVKPKKTRSGRGASGPSAEDLKLRKEEIELQQALAVAREANDTASELALQRQLDLRARIREYEDAGLDKKAAAVAAEKDMAELAEVRAIEQAKAIDQEERQLDMQLAELRGDFEHLNFLKDQQYVEERIAVWKSKGLELAEAEKRAQQDLLDNERARSELLERRVADQERERQLELARIRGDSPASIRAREEEFRRGDRYAQLRDEGKSEAEARRIALEEGADRARAHLQGTFRDTFRDGLQAALNGNLKGFFKNWLEQRAFESLSRVLDRLADQLANLVSSGGGKGGGGFKDIIGGFLGLSGGGGDLFKNTGLSGSSFSSSKSISSGKSVSGGKTPGFATGGRFTIKGFSGIDKNLLSLNGNPIARVSSGEIMNIQRGDLGGAGSAPYFDLRGAVMTQDLLDQMNRIGSQASVQGGMLGSQSAQTAMSRAADRRLE